MAQLAYARWGSLGNVAQHGVGADGGLAGLDMALGYPAPAYNAIARTPAFGGLMMIEMAGCLPGPYGPGYKLARCTADAPRPLRNGVSCIPGPWCSNEHGVPAVRRACPERAKRRDRAKLRAGP